MPNEDEARLAIATLNETELLGRIIREIDAGSEGRPEHDRFRGAGDWRGRGSNIGNGSDRW